MYRVIEDNHPLSFCSTDHARVGVGRWEEKKKLGVRPGQPQPAKDTPEMIGDNMQELEEGGE